MYKKIKKVVVIVKKGEDLCIKEIHTFTAVFQWIQMKN